MRSPLRLLNAWLDLHRLEDRRRQVEWQLGIALREPLQLLPAKLSGGSDRVFLARTQRWHSHVAASVRIARPDRVVSESESDPHLLRRRLTADERLARECRAYQRLSVEGLAPRLLARGPEFLANQYLPWLRLSAKLRRDPGSFWSVLPVVLEAMQQMHGLGVTHLDPNCGNLLLSPDGRRAVWIDFEYGPPTGALFPDLQRFDWLRLINSLLQPRRGGRAIEASPRRFLRAVASFVPNNCESGTVMLSPAGFPRVLEQSLIAEELAEMFGLADPAPAEAAPSRRLRRLQTDG
jgi:hypothetical protein